ncbi:MAG: SpoIIE family protein phosphatase [Chloroflexota bacterium]
MSTELLRCVPLLATLPPGELAHLATAARGADYSTGALLFREGSADDHLCVLAEGVVEIVKALGGPDERRLAVCEPGALLGEMSLFSADGAHTASVRALTPVRVLELDRVAFDALLQRQPRLAYAVMRQLSQRLDEGEHSTIRDLRDKNRNLALAYRDLQAAQAQLVEKERLERELELARGIQESMLPQELPVIPGYDLGAMMVPARLVGGDFYDALALGGGRLALAVGDVCGKGVPAALFMAQSFGLLRAEASRNASPVETLRAVNRHLLAVNRSEMYVTLLYAVLEAATGRLHYARAGHPPLLMMHRDGSLSQPPAQPGQMLGLFDEPLLDEGSVTLSPGSLALIYSDGLAEALDAHGQEFDPRQIGDVMAARPQVSAQALCEALWGAVCGGATEPAAQDDFTVLALRRVG